MDTICPYCGVEIWFEDDEWADMTDGQPGCARGYCPECDADCCYLCRHVYAPGNLSMRQRMPQSRQREQPLQKPNYPF